MEHTDLYIDFDRGGFGCFGVGEHVGAVSK